MIDRPRTRHARFVAAVSAWLVLTGSLASAQPAVTEPEVKAAYLYSFGKFVDWPAGDLAGGAEFFQICVMGKDPFGPVLDGILKNAVVDGKAAVARRVSRADDVSGCRILFVSTSEEAALDSIFMALNRTPVLTVSDIPRFTDRGGMIRFVTDGRRVRFEINLMPAQQAGLVLRSDLLRVAISVRK